MLDRSLLRLLSLFVLLFLPHSACNRAPEHPTVTLDAVGDVMLGRHIGKVMASRGDDAPFQHIATALRSTDLVLGNFEAPIAADDADLFFPDKPYSFHASPRSAPAVRSAGFHLLSLANNHALDYGGDALINTRSLLEAAGVQVFGAGKDLTEARKPVIVTRKGIRFGFLGYGVAHSKRVYATKARPGIAPIVLEDIRKDLEALRPQVDVVVLSLHWGTEYEPVPSARQRAEAHQFVDWGADLVVGHHPHVMQGVEVYQGRIIAYSLGNFVFDQQGKGTDRSFILEARFTKTGPAGGRIIPLDRKTRYFPNAAEGRKGAELIAEVKRLSLPINSSMKQLRLVGME